MVLFFINHVTEGVYSFRLYLDFYPLSLTFFKQIISQTFGVQEGVFTTCWRDYRRAILVTVKKIIAAKDFAYLCFHQLEHFFIFLSLVNKC